MLAVQEQTTFAIEMERLKVGERRHGPTIAYRIDNAVLGDGTLYYNGGYDVLRSKSSRPLLPRDSDAFAEMQLCTNHVVDRYFGHWLIDGQLLELLAEQLSRPGLALHGVPWLHEPGYRELSGLSITRSGHARIDRLWVIDDRGLNDSLVSRLMELRRRVRSAGGRNSAKRVILARGSLGAKRNLVNSVEVHEALGLLGFEIVNPEAEAPRTIVEKLSAAEFAVAVEGSAANHCWPAMPVGSTFLAIQPPTRFNAHGKMRADAIGMNWAYVVADPHPDGFFLPVDRLLRTIDEVVRVAGTRV